MGRRKEPEPEPEPEDTSGWLIDNSLANFLIFNAQEVKYMAMLGYTFYHGCKLYKTFPPKSAISFRFVSMVLQCTGGGILVPIFINSIPVPLTQDAYPVAIVTSFLLHEYFPFLRELIELSALFKAAVIVLYETLRASVVIKLTYAAGNAIAPSEFSFPLFGPIFCGTIAGCGGAFLPLDKGLSPIKNAGLGQPMLSAFVAATFFHLYLNTSWSDGVIEAKKKASIFVAVFFILYNLNYSWAGMMATKEEEKEPAPVVEGKKTK